jgi:hypothetical protein
MPYRFDGNHANFQTVGIRRQLDVSRLTGFSANNHQTKSVEGFAVM